MQGNCEFGEQCTFAHGFQQLRSKKSQQQKAQKLLQHSVMQMHQFKESQKPRSISEDFVNKYKTELCRNWEMEKFCQFGIQCAFAHGVEELRRKHSGMEINSLYSTPVVQVEKPQAIPYQYYQDVQTYEQPVEQFPNYLGYQQYMQSNLTQGINNITYKYPQFQPTTQFNQLYNSQNQLQQQEQFNQQRRSTDPLKAPMPNHTLPQTIRRCSEQNIIQIQQMQQKPEIVEFQPMQQDIRRFSAYSTASTQISTCANQIVGLQGSAVNSQFTNQKQVNNEKEKEITYVKSLIGDELLDEIEKSPVQYTKRLSTELKDMKTHKITQSQSSQDFQPPNRSLSYTQTGYNQISPPKEYSYFTQSEKKQNASEHLTKQLTQEQQELKPSQFDINTTVLKLNN